MLDNFEAYDITVSHLPLIDEPNGPNDEDPPPPSNQGG